MRKAIVVSTFLLFACASQRAANDRTLAKYLEKHGRSPEEYVVSKFVDHDVVFLGEFHRIRHDALFVQRLIPRLYAAGVYTLGIEFGARAEQSRVDALINAPAYDEGLARDILFRYDVTWGYREYEDLYRAAWELNHRLPPDAHRFRVLNLNYAPNWPALTEDPQSRRLLWPQGSADEFMARTILEEVVLHGEKALIYSGCNHAFTRFHQPRRGNGTVLFATERMGNLVYAKIGNRAFNIYLDAPFPVEYEANTWTWPAGGAIARAAALASRSSVGFDVAGSPFGTLPDRSVYSLGTPDFRLAMFCDGYVYMRDEGDETIACDPLFVTPENLADAISRYPVATARPKIKDASYILDATRHDANVPQWAKRAADSTRQ